MLASSMFQRSHVDLIRSKSNVPSDSRNAMAFEAIKESKPDGSKLPEGGNPIVGDESPLIPRDTVSE